MICYFRNRTIFIFILYSVILLFNLQVLILSSLLWSIIQEWLFLLILRWRLRSWWGYGCFRIYYWLNTNLSSADLRCSFRLAQRILFIPFHNIISYWRNIFYFPFYLWGLIKDCFLLLNFGIWKYLRLSWLDGCRYFFLVFWIIEKNFNWFHLIFLLWNFCFRIN